MKFKVGDTVVLKVNGKRYKIVGDSKTPVSDLFFGPKYLENTKDFLLKKTLKYILILYKLRKRIYQI